MSMARDELADRVRDLLPRGVHAVEKKMFGGLAFMVHGNMLVAMMKDGSMLVRVGKEGMETALALPGAQKMEMGERTMGGFVQVTGDALEDDEALAGWLHRAWTHVKMMPAK